MLKLRAFCCDASTKINDEKCGWIYASHGSRSGNSETTNYLNNLNDLKIVQIKWSSPDFVESTQMLIVLKEIILVFDVVHHNEISTSTFSIF